MAPGALASRPRLTAAILLGVAVGAGLSLVPNPLAWHTRAILSWDLTCGFFLAAAFLQMRGRDLEFMRTRAAFEDEGGAAILLLTLMATAASLGTVAAELQASKAGDGLEKAVRVSLAFLTTGLSWLFVHVMFALHYAREFYAPDQEKDGETRGGLVFPGTEGPDYWDFLHFSLIIGVASQTADIQITSQALRRIGTLHSTMAFLFNTVVLALTINLLASLF
jgi:uncharacterized membrane protein